MRKLLPIACAVAMLCSAVSSMHVSAASELTMENYDITGDGVLNGLDLSAIKQQVVAGERSIVDAVVLQRWILGNPLEAKTTTPAIATPTTSSPELGKAAVSLDFDSYAVTEKNTDDLISWFTADNYRGATNPYPCILSYSFEDDNFEYDILASSEFMADENDTELASFHISPDSRVEIVLYACDEGYYGIEYRM